MDGLRIPMASLVAVTSALHLLMIDSKMAYHALAFTWQIES